MKFTEEDMLVLLSAPFPVESLSWRVGNKSNWDKVNKRPKDSNKPVKAQMLVYIDARDVMDRLDEVCGINWKDDFKEVDRRLVCNLQIGNTVRSDGAGDTDFEGEKGGLSDAFKRAAVKFGVGRYLYNAKNFNTWIEYAVGETDLDVAKKAKETFSDIARRLGEPVQTYHFWLGKIKNSQSLEELEEYKTLARVYSKREQWSTGNNQTLKDNIEKKNKELGEKNERN